jgi:hypothetical protein
MRLLAAGAKTCQIRKRGSRLWVRRFGLKVLGSRLTGGRVPSQSSIKPVGQTGRKQRENRR